MVVKLIPCAAIDVMKVSDDVRTFNREFAVHLAESLRVNRPLMPIAVRPNPASPERFLLVSGKHRLYATKMVLKEPRIAARVFEDMDDAEAELARDAENLWRCPLTAPQQAAAIKRWHAYWLSTLPPLPASDEAGAASSASSNSDDSEAKESRKPESHKEATFDQKVADATGQSVQNVRRAKRVAKAFTEEQLEVFAQRRSSQVDMLWVAKIKDKARRDAVVGLVAEGRSVVEAIGEVMEDAAPSRFNAKADARTTRKANGTATAHEEPELSDDEWFDRHCGTKAAMLSDPARFKSDALLFRAISGAREAFRSGVNDALTTTKASGTTGGLWDLVNRVANLSQPADWPICTHCFGRGTVATADHAERVEVAGSRAANEECPRCDGGDYLLCEEGSAWGFGV